MKSYIAYGVNGKNIRFEKQSELMAHFELSSRTQIERLLEKGNPIEDPDTLELYYIDELESDLGAAKV